MSDLLERLRGYNPPDRTVDDQRQIAQDIHDAADEIERLTAYAEGLEADARRYRFLRDAAYNLDAVPYVVTGPHGATEPITGAELDKAIDERPELDHQRVPGAVPSSDNASHSIRKSEEAGHASGPTTPGRPTDGHRAPIAEDVGSSPTREATISQSGVGNDSRSCDVIGGCRNCFFNCREPHACKGNDCRPHPNYKEPLKSGEETPAERYRRENPLGGPAKLFYAIADRITAGEDFHFVLRDMGMALVDERPQTGNDSLAGFIRWLDTKGLASSLLGWDEAAQRFTVRWWAERYAKERPPLGTQPKQSICTCGFGPITGCRVCE